MTVTAAIAVVAVALSPVAPTGAPVATQIGTQPDQVIVAAARSVVLNERTNTLYVLDIANGAVEARDAVTSELKARIEVGGKPTALALNPFTNTVLVLDSSQKTVTEIDGAKNSVVSSSSVPVNGTLTSINVEPGAGKVVLAREHQEIRGEPGLVSVALCRELHFRGLAPRLGGLDPLSRGLERRCSVQHLGLDRLPRLVDGRFGLPLDVAGHGGVSPRGAVENRKPQDQSGANGIEVASPERFEGLVEAPVQV